MLMGASRVLTFGSTIGIEATFWGRPAICLDFSFYDGLDAQYEPADEAELFSLLLGSDLAPKPRENALRFGYYLNTYGGEFRHFSTAQISDYTFQSPFRGRCLRPDYDDLRQRIFALIQAGHFARAGRLAQLLVEFNPADGPAHSMQIICHAKLGAAEMAITALEVAATQLSAAEAEQMLRNVVPTLIDTFSRQLGQATHPKSKGCARRAAAVLSRHAIFAPIAQKLANLAAAA
jgi:hypothetical protein